MNQATGRHGAISSPANLSVSTLKNQSTRPAGPKSKARESRLGLPDFKWTMTLLGLCIYSFAIITFKFPVAQLGIAMGVMGLLSGRNPVQKPTPFLLYLAFMFWALVASFTSPFADVALETVVERLKLLVVLLIAMNAFQTEGQFRFYLLLILGCFILFPARGTFLGGDTVQGRAVWTHVYNNPNDLAALCLLAFGVALAIVFSETTWNPVRLGCGISAAILLVVILRTQSRGVFLGIIIAIAPGFIPILLKQLRLAIGMGIVVGLVLSFAIPPKTWERLGGIKKLTSTEAVENQNDSNEADSSAAQRLEIVKTGWKIFLDHPIFGMGLGAYPLANNMYSPFLGKRDTHNTYINLAAETGLPGLVIWCSLVWSVLYRAYRARQRAAESPLKIQNYWLGQALLGYLVAGTFGSYSGLNFLYLMLSALWCSTNLLVAASPRPMRRVGAGRT